MISSKEDFQRLVNHLSSLVDVDLDVLKSLGRHGTTSDLALAAHLSALPSDVQRSLERLSNLGFVESARPRERTLEVSKATVKLSSYGEDAVKLLPLVENIR